MPSSFFAGAVTSVKEKGVKYMGVSVINVIVGQGLLVLFHAVLHWNQALANAVSVCISAVPAYYLSRAWVWGRTGKSHFKTEVLPFWIFIGIGLVFSTAMVALVSHLTGAASTPVSQMTLAEKLLPNLVNAASFFILWILRFFLFEHMFTTNPELAEELMGVDFAEAIEGHDAVAAAEAAQAERRTQTPTDVDPELRAHAEAARGFMPPDEGLALYEAAASVPAGGSPLLEIGSYCGKSAVYLGAGATVRGTILFVLDHHRGSEENQPGWEWHEPDLVDPAVGRIDTLPSFRATVHAAGLEASVVALVGDSPTVGRHWAIPLSLLFIDGGHGHDPAHRDYELWAPHVEPDGLLVIHDVFPDPADGGRPPFEIYTRALASGAFTEIRAVGSLRVLRRVAPGI